MEDLELWVVVHRLIGVSEIEFVRRNLFVFTDTNFYVLFIHVISHTFAVEKLIK